MNGPAWEGRDVGVSLHDQSGKRMKSVLCSSSKLNANSWECKLSCDGSPWSWTPRPRWTLHTILRIVECNYCTQRDVRDAMRDLREMGRQLLKCQASTAITMMATS